MGRATFDSGYEVAFEDDGLRVATVDNVCISAWFEEPTLERMRIMDRSYKSLRHQLVRGGVFVSIAVEGVPRFSAEVRAEAARQTAATGKRDLVTCHLVLLRGLTGSAVRAFMSTMVLVGRPAHPTKVFGDPMVASRWIANLVPRDDGSPWAPDDLNRMMNLTVLRQGRPAPALRRR